ncbi:MAG: hypothetical protein V3U27_20600 [Candidatus Tectomicrobia bacterium]
MTHSQAPSSSPPSRPLTPRRSLSPPPETARVRLDRDWRIQFAQRLAVLIQRMQAQHRDHPKKEPCDAT